jgi:hypothetical protein
MKRQWKTLCMFFLFGFRIAILQAQETIPVTGVTATGSGGSVSYTVGQIANNMLAGTNGTSAPGVQQPYEISVVTAIDNSPPIRLECRVYPNPTSGIVRLIFESNEYEDLRFRLYDITGALLQDKKIESIETEISLGNSSSSVYFLKVYKNNIELTVYKIVKK